MLNDYTNGKIKDHKSLLLCVDGGCEPKNPGGVATYGWVIYDANDNDNILVTSYAVVQDGGSLATNNYAEYCSLGFSLKWLRDQGWSGNLTVQGDSQLLIYQVAERWKCKAQHLVPLRARIWEHIEAMGLVRCTDEDSPEYNFCILRWVPREQNAYADELSNTAYREHLQNRKKK
jgi:ribonuclease HI